MAKLGSYDDPYFRIESISSFMPGADAQTLNRFFHLNHNNYLILTIGFDYDGLKDGSLGSFFKNLMTGIKRLFMIQKQTEELAKNIDENVTHFLMVPFR